MKSFGKYIAPLVMSCVYVFIGVFVKGDMYGTLISAPVSVAIVATITLVRYKFDMLPKESPYSYFITSLFITQVFCLLLA